MVKRTASLILLISLLLSYALLLSGCSDSSESDTLTVSVDKSKCSEFYDAMVAKFPGIEFKVTPLKERASSDIIYHSNLTELNEDIDLLLDLSGYPFMGNIRDDVLQILDVGGKIYQIPGPLEINCIVYNKTLFAENGWQVPKSFGELLTLVKTIRQQKPEITPIEINLDGSGNAFNIVTAFSQTGFLSTPDGYEWEKKFLNNDSSVEVGFSEGFDMLSALIDANAFDAEKYVGGAGFDDQLTTRKAAMEFYFDNTDKFFETIGNSGVTADEFGFLPFLGINESEKLVGFHADSAWSVNKKLAEGKNKKKLKNALSVMEWITSAEAQSLLGNNSTRIPVVKGIDDSTLDSHFSELWSMASDGYKANAIYSGYEHIIDATSIIIVRAMLADSSVGMREEFISAADKLNREHVKENHNK